MIYHPKNYKHLAVVLFSILVSYQVESQTILNGFFSEKGKATVALTYTNKTYSKFYAGKDLANELPANFGEIELDIVNLYGQYAITDWLTGVINIPYISITNENNVADPINNEAELSGIQDLGLFVKARAVHAKLERAAFTLGVGLGFTTPISDYAAAGILSIGNRATSIDGYLITQYKHDNGIFLEAQYGYAARSGVDDFEVPNAHLLNFKVGFAHKYFYTDFQVGVQNSIDGTDIGSAEFGLQGGPTSFPNTQVDYTNLALNLYVPICKGFGITTAFDALIEGRNVGKYRAYKAGLVYSF